ncbi:MAG TPA: hypothetical protein VMV66_01860 [Candidatus Humimicrobiaceae bacterium]|nr:hypothetical protein [Candidatus Humimicrobiaceae bacterium]
MAKGILNFLKDLLEARIIKQKREKTTIIVRETAAFSHPKLSINAGLL